MTILGIPQFVPVLCGALVAVWPMSPVRAASVPAGQPHIAQQQDAMTISPGELADHPDRYYGKRVKITGEVEDVYSRSVFAVDEDRLWSTGRDVLVLNPNAVARVNEDRSVTVQGIVRPFRYTDVDSYISWHGWQWDLARVYENRFSRRPIVIADSIVAANNRELVMQGDKVRSSTAEYGKPAISKPVVLPANVIFTTPEDLSQHPEKYYGKTVSIFGDAEDTFGTRLFSIDEDRLWSTGEDVLVLARDVDPSWRDLAYVQVRGKVMRFARDEVQKRIDKARAVGTRFWADFQDRPVIVAESITGPDGRELMKNSGTAPRR